MNGVSLISVARQQHLEVVEFSDQNLEDEGAFSALERG